MIVFVMYFNTSNAPMDSKVDTVSEFKITQISGNGNIFHSKTPIDRRRLSRASRVDIKEMHYSDDTYLLADSHTAFECFCFGVRFVVQPGSYMCYQPKSKEIRLYEGDFDWHKETKKKGVDVSIHREMDTTPPVITLSDAGRVQVTADSIRVWNYKGNAAFNYAGESFALETSRQMIYRRNGRINSSPLLQAPAPGTLDPLEKIVALSQPGDSVVKFNWRTVKGAQSYFFRLYPSSLMEDIIFEKEVSDNRFSLDLLKFDDFADFYWQVIAYNSESKREGIPSALGYLKLKGALLNKEQALKPPNLEIKPLVVSGAMVIIQGKTDPGVELYINDDPVTVTMDGTFDHTVSFPTMGRNRIVFRAVSPSGVDTIIEEYVTTFDE